MKPMTSLDQLDRAIVVLAQRRTCSVCGAPTMIATSGQTAHGRCLTCISAPQTDEVAADADDRAIDACMDAFDGALVEFDWQPPTYPPDTYRGHDLVYVTGEWIRHRTRYAYAVWVPVRDAGPCTRCHRTIRRYGPFGSATCTTCKGTS